jgi:hypothetical protein
MCFNWLKKKEYMDLFPPSGLIDISGLDILDNLLFSFSGSTIYVTDDKYKTTVKSEIQRFLDYDNTNEIQYNTDYYDCEDYAFRLLGQFSIPDWSSIPIGIVFCVREDGVDHAVNCFVDSSHNVWLIEPKSDTIFKCPTSWKYVLVLI